MSSDSIEPTPHSEATIDAGERLALVSFGRIPFASVALKTIATSLLQSSTTLRLTEATKNSFGTWTIGKPFANHATITRQQPSPIASGANPLAATQQRTVARWLSPRRLRSRVLAEACTAARRSQPVNRIASRHVRRIVPDVQRIHTAFNLA